MIKKLFKKGLKNKCQFELTYHVYDFECETKIIAPKNIRMQTIE